MSFWIRFFLVFLFFVAALLFAEPKKGGLTDEQRELLERNISVQKEEISAINEKLEKSVWYKRYEDALSNEEHRDHIFGDLIKVEMPKRVVKVDSPLDIFSALSFIKESTVKKEMYESRVSELDRVVELLEKRFLILQSELEAMRALQAPELESLETAVENEKVVLKRLKKERAQFRKEVDEYKSKSDEEIQKLQMDIDYQLSKLFNILLLVAAVFILSWLAKLMVKRYFTKSHERAYLLAKTINLTTIVLLGLILLFSFINDVGYIVTILGFASAGIAIAMKDLFMSLLGWMAIILSGAIKVGDRVKISSKEGVEILGDIIDISLLTITMYEEISFVSYEKNKRAGRVVFVPNNYIFTHIFLNYSHSGLSTVWDNINIRITFDSDVERALEIAKEVAAKHSKVFSKLTDRAIRRMRAKYSIGDIQTEPRVFSFIEQNGVAISIWYPTNSFNILKIKSQISKELLDSLKAEEGIKIAYPTTSVILNKVSRDDERVFDKT